MNRQRPLSPLAKVLVSALLALVLWLPRGLQLDRFVAVDERSWLTRSANFYLALHQRDWAATFQRYHPGVTIEQIQKKTGFTLEITPDIHETPPPTADEIRLLREEIDPLGVRKLETLGGGARKDLLREILRQEGAL